MAANPLQLPEVPVMLYLMPGCALARIVSVLRVLWKQTPSRERSQSIFLSLAGHFVKHSINVPATVRSPGHDAFTAVPRGLVAKPIALCLLRTFQHLPDFPRDAAGASVLWPAGYMCRKRVMNLVQQKKF